MNSYLLTIDLSETARDSVVNCIDNISSIENWMFFFDNTACIVSEKSTDELSEIIHTHLPSMQFVLVKLAGIENRAGWLRKSVWKFMKRPGPVGERSGEIVRLGET